MRLGSLGHSGQGRLSKSDLSLCDGFDSQDFYNWNSLVRSEQFRRYQREDAQSPLGLAKGYGIGFYRAVPVEPPEKAPKHGGSKLKAAGIATAGILGTGAAYGMLSDSDGDGTPNYEELFGEKPALPTPYIMVDKDLDGLPDDLEEKWGYSTSEKDVRLKYWVQDPEENKSLVDAALEKVVNDYKEKNPLKINVHTHYGGEIPADAFYSSDRVNDFWKSTRTEYNNFGKFLIDEYHSPTGAGYQGNLDDVFFLTGYFFDEEGMAQGISGIKVTQFNIFTKQPNGMSLPSESMAYTIMHEMAHGMGLEHSTDPNSIVGSPLVGEDFVEDEWTFLKNEPLLDFRPNPIVAKYVPE